MLDGLSSKLSWAFDTCGQLCTCGYRFASIDQESDGVW